MKNKMLQRQKGFSLMELLIALVIVAVLASVAVPSYNSYMAKGKLAQAVTQLNESALRMEQYFLDNRTYSGAGGGCGGVLANGDNFAVTCATSNGGLGYTLTAQNVVNVGLGAAAAYTFTLDHQGNQATTSFAGQAAAANCWWKQANTCM